MVEGLGDYFRRVKFVLDPVTYSILRFEDRAQPHFVDALSHFRADGDQTVVVPLETARKMSAPAGLKGRDDGWRRITIQVQVPLTTAGFFRKFADALAEARISILIVSGYLFEHVMVHEVNVDRALALMKSVAERESQATAAVRS